jgi:histone deacetylase 1/2
MQNCKICPSPTTSGTTLSSAGGPLLDDPHQYRSVVGALQYATLTRPDISFAVNKVSQFMHNPTSTHWGAVKRILRYLRGTLHHGLNLSSDSPLDIHAYCDADWAGCPDDRRSTTGFCIFLANNLVSWSAKKQPTVSRSSTEAEYRSLALTCAELLWLQYLLAELHVKQNCSTLLPYGVIT